MKRLTIAVLAAWSSVCGARAPEPALSEADEGSAVTSKITAVTVYADRASVVRTATVELAPGVQKFAFRKLPGWIDEGSVRVSVTPADAGELLDVQVCRTYLARPEDEELRKADADLQELSDQMGVLDDQRAVLDAQSRQLDAIRAFSLDKMPKDAVVREVKVEEYGALIKFIGVSMADLAKAGREIDRKKRDLQPQLDARQRKVQELRQRAQLEQRTVIATTRRAAGAAGPAVLSLTYMLPGATWEPVHELRASNALDRVTISSFGTVTQTTGEEWDGVALTLSTQRSTETIRIPELEKLLVGPREAGGNNDTFSAASGKFNKQIMLWNSFVNRVEDQAEFRGNWEAQQVAQAGNIRKFAKVQEKRGTTAHFASTGVQTIRTDGRAVRVPIGAVQLAAQPKIVAAPEVSLNAARTVDLVNAGRQPLLPGRVLLYVEGAFLGATETDFVAPGEAFPLFVGVADAVRLSRALDTRQSSLSWSGKRKRLQVVFLVGTENLSDAPVALQLADRIPVSETEDVRVNGVRIQPAAEPDAKGVLRWNVSLAARERKEFRIEYTLDYPADYRRVTPANAPAQQEDLQIQGVPAAKGQPNMADQIELLEKKL